VGLQALQLLWEVFEWPLTPLRVLIGVVAAGFPIFVLLAWRRGVSKTTVDDTAETIRVHTSHVGRTVVTAVVVVGLIAGVAWSVDRSLDRAWARGEAVLELRRLADIGDFEAALQLGAQILDVVSPLPAVDSALDEVSITMNLETNPPGAEVQRRDYSNVDAPWIHVGTTPITDARVPRGVYRWRMQAAGRNAIELAWSPNWVGVIQLPHANSVPDDMVMIPGGSSGGFVTGMGPMRALEHDDFFIGRYEVTNSEYREFVSAGGYEDDSYWLHSIIDQDGTALSWEEAMTRFTDATGRPGPAMWELGRPREGMEDLPVTGVSWYEAAAYAEFREAQLPSLRHWIRASGTRLGGSIIPMSNFGGDGPAAAGTFEGMSPSGAFDMAGNVREWLHNSAGSGRHAVGGAWSDDSYFFSGPNVQRPIERLPENGIRLAHYDEQDFDGQALVDMPLLTREYHSEQPVSDEVFNVYKAQFDYDDAPLDATVEEVIDHRYGTVERVSFTGVGWGRIHGYLFLPADTAPPHQVVVWFPGSSSARYRPDPDPGSLTRLEHFVAAGRAFFWPVIRSTYSRADSEQATGMNHTWPRPTREYVDLARSWVSEYRRSIDYLVSRPDIDAERIAYIGTSWGGRYAAIVPAVEPRISLVLSILGGLASGTALPEVDQINYVTRVTVPTLMLNGRDDPLQPVESAQIPMYRLLGTPAEDKKHIVYPGYAHNIPRNEGIRDMLDWLDRYYGVPASK
jgi:cephalosporin-C deacetylase-like acetyl esterase